MFLWKNFCLISLVIFVFHCCLQQGYCFDTESDIVLDLKAPQFSDLSDEQKMLISEFGARYSQLVKFYGNTLASIYKSNNFNWLGLQSGAVFVFFAKNTEEIGIFSNGVTLKMCNTSFNVWGSWNRFFSIAIMR